MPFVQFWLPPVGSEELYLQSFLMIKTDFITENGKEYLIRNTNISTTIMVKVGSRVITVEKGVNTYLSLYYD